MELGCGYVGVGRLQCWEPAAMGGSYCRWHLLIDNLSGTRLGWWRWLLGFLFFFFIGPYGLEAFQQLRQVIAFGKGNFLFVYVNVCATLYFGSLGMLLFSEQVLWPKIFAWSQAFYGLYFLGYAVATPRSGGVLDVWSIMLGLFLIMLAVLALRPSDAQQALGEVYIATALFLLIINNSVVSVFPVMLLCLFFAFLLDQYYGWSRR